MKQVEAQINISIDLECPHCDEYIDLMDQNQWQGLHDDGYIYNKIFGYQWGCKDFNEKITCPKCKEDIVIKSVVY